ncbi:MAG: DUF4097 domain-containing protein [Olsenella sp.]|jgi:hypothetical protein|nr:DUF4097 domain-containing protein [Olsenella sp.]
MMDDIRDYLESVFSKLPQTPEAHRAKDELGQMMEDKYAELLAQGMSEKDAAEATIAEFGNPDEVLESLGVKPQQGRKRHPGRVIAAVLGVIALCCVCWVVFWGRAEADPHAGSVDATIAEDFSSVDVHAACADVVLKSGDVTQVSYSGAANTSFEYEVQDGVLRVTQQQTSNVGVQASDGIVITVVVPTTVELASVGATSDLGSVDLQGVEAARTDVSSQMGDVSVSGIDLSSATLELFVDMGQITLDGSAVSPGTVVRGTGEKVLAASAQMGDVNVTAL